MKVKRVWITAVVLFCAVTLISIFIEKPSIFSSQTQDERGFIASSSPDTEMYGQTKKSSALESIRKLFFPEIIKTRTDSIIDFAMQHLGKPYIPAGRDSCGFDCSGFIHFVFKEFGIYVPHQSALLDKTGDYVPFNELRKGDILIFTGTNSKIRDPGHVGIVITDNGGPVQFIHSSSYEGVKISQVDSTRYETRYLSARRVLGE